MEAILNPTLIANEAIDSRLRSHRGEVVCKLDTEKILWPCKLELSHGGDAKKIGLR